MRPKVGALSFSRKREKESALAPRLSVRVTTLAWRRRIEGGKQTLQQQVAARHVVPSQNDDNVAKTPVVKFGRAVIDDPSNMVYIPRLKHELITADFNSEVPTGSQGETLRDLVDDLDFNDQRSFGLYMLRRYGILQ